jgi:hypothetical protein
MVSVLSLALDCGFKWIVVLSGRTVVLHQQTHGRFNADLQGPDRNNNSGEENNVEDLTEEGWVVGFECDAFLDEPSCSVSSGEEEPVDLTALSEMTAVNWLTSNKEDISGRNNMDRFESINPKQPTIAIIKKTAASLKWIQTLLDPTAEIRTKKETKMAGYCAHYRNCPGTTWKTE